MIKNPYLRILHRENPIGTLFLYFPTIIALFVATNGIPPIKLIFVFTLGVIIARTAGCVFNDIIDRKLDAKVERTADRPMAKNELTLFQGLFVFISLVVFALILLIGFLPVETYPFAAVSAILLVIYPLAKRYIKIPQIVLALAYSMPIFMVYAALDLNPFVSVTAWLLFVANAFWVVAYDTNYAVSDLYDDLKQEKIYSSAIYFGTKCNLIVLLLNVLYLVFFAIVGLVNSYGYLFYVMLGCNLLIFIFQYFYVSDEDPETGIKVFYQNLYVGLITSLAVLFGLIGMNHNVNQTKYQELLVKYNSLQADYSALQTKYNTVNPQITNGTESQVPVTVDKTKEVKTVDNKPASDSNKVQPVKPADTKPTESKPTKSKPSTNTDKVDNTKVETKPTTNSDNTPVTTPTEEKPVTSDTNTDTSKPANSTNNADKEKPVTPVNDKPADSKPTDAKPDKDKPSDTKPADTKPVKADPSTDSNETKSEPVKPAETKKE